MIVHGVEVEVNRMMAVVRLWLTARRSLWYVRNVDALLRWTDPSF